MFAINKIASKTLLPLVESLFTEVLAFGKLAILNKSPASLIYPISPTELERLKGYVEKRYLPITLLFHLLEQSAGLRFTGEECLPFRFNQATWPDKTPLAGYTSSASLLPSQFVASLFSNWLHDTIGSEGGRFHRVFRSALWVSLHHGIEKGVHYAFDLLETGAAIDCSAVAQTVVYLLAARSQTNSNQEMVDRLIKGGIPKTQHGWLVFDSDLSWLDFNQISDSMGSVLLTVIEKCIHGVEKVRNLPDLDTWVASYSSLAAMLYTISRIIRSTHPQLPLSLRAVLSSFEEIWIDEESLRFTMAAGMFQGQLEYARYIAYQFREAVGNGWEKRMQRERLLLPAQLHSLLLTNEEKLPPDWLIPSSRLAYPWTFLRTNRSDPRAISFQFADGRGPEMVLLDEDSHLNHELDSVEDLLDRGHIEQALARLHQLLQQHPWHFAVHFHLSFAYQELENIDAARSHLIHATALALDHPHCWEYFKSFLQRIGDRQEFTLASFLEYRFSQEASNLENFEA